MTIPNYTRVEIVTDRFEPLGVPKGTHGYVIEIHDEDNYEVEVSDPERRGVTVALFVAKRHEIEPVE